MLPKALLEHPLFADLSPEGLRGLEPHLHIERYERGACLFRRGDAGDSLYVVVSGQISLEVPSNGESRVVAVCGPDDWFGEVALFTAGPRTANASVSVDAVLARIDRDGWAELRQRAPGAFAALCRRLSRQLRATTDPAPRAGRKVVACHGSDGESSWLLKLVSSLKRQFPKRNVQALGSDGTLLLGEQRASIRSRPHRGRVEQALAQNVAHDSLILLATSEMDDLADVRVMPTGINHWTIAPGRTGNRRNEIRGSGEIDAIDRLARHLAHGTVGLALGAGGAFGLSHLGLLRVLDSAKVPTDFITGTSIGAIVGGAMAAGVSVQRMIEFAEGVAARYRRIVLRDLDIRGSTLLTGDGVSKVLGELPELRDASFADLRVPFAAVAMDLKTGEQVTSEFGQLLDGIRPSFAMPGIFPPCAKGEALLVDGAMVNPVPVDLTRTMGADFVIAAQPIPELKPDARDPLGGSVGRARRLADFLPFSGLRNGLDALNVTLRSFQSLWYQLAASSALNADVVTAPDLSEFWFLQFGDASRIIEAGEQHAEKILPAVRTLLKERVGLELAASTQPVNNNPG